MCNPNMEAKVHELMERLDLTRNIISRSLQRDFFFFPVATPPTSVLRSLRVFAQHTRNSTETGCGGVVQLVESAVTSACPVDFPPS